MYCACHLSDLVQSNVARYRRYAITVSFYLLLISFQPFNSVDL
ncbi:DUF751 domain-containing protein [Vibrio sp. OPT10]|nr:DUF751 domain-containing protein [Vibrio sp. OPT10]